jgi:hypothetical protein
MRYGHENRCDLPWRLSVNARLAEDNFCVNAVFSDAAPLLIPSRYAK